jgi:glycosyltransferase involved in cell wall biosynthesis
VKRVLVIVNNLQQASFRLRIGALVNGLRERGVDLDVQLRPRRAQLRRRLLKSAGDYDAAILQRKLLDPRDMRLLRKSARKLFFDVDDAVMYHSRPVGPLKRWQTWRRFLAVARYADLIVAGNEYLAELFRGHGGRAMVLPTVVDPAGYQVKSHAATEAPALVWIGSKSTLPYLRRFAPALAEAKKRVAGLRMITIADQPLAGSALSAEHVPWSQETESAALCRGDIGIAPTPRDRWTLGKCGFKIVQYMAAGLPVIASPVGANSEIVAPGETGFLAKDQAEWADAIAALAEDPGKRQAMGSAGRKRVERLFSIARAVEVWAELLSGDVASR